MYTLGGLIRSVPFFKNAELDFLQELVSLLRFEVYLQDEVIIKGGSKGNKMFFVEHGLVDIVTVSGEVAATLDKGSHFGGLFSLPIHMLIYSDFSESDFSFVSYNNRNMNLEEQKDA